MSAVLLLGALVWLAPLSASAQDVVDMKQFSPKEMDALWDQFGKDQGWAAINKDVATKKFQRIKHEKASWGFKGSRKNAKGQMEDVIFCAFDFYNPNSKNGQGCSMIWRKVGGETYKAYLIFPDGEKDFDKALEASLEWFADEKGQIQKANSWGRCFRRCNRSICGPGCLASIAVCGGATAILAVATGGLGVPGAAIVFGICAGYGCGFCMAGCAVGCM